LIIRNILLIVVAVAALSGSARAQTLASVGGVPITLADVLAANPAAKNDTALRKQVLLSLINRQAVLNEAERLGLAKTEEYSRALEQDQENLLIHMMFEQFVDAHPVSEPELEAAYRRSFDRPLPDEYRLREILVTSFPAAREIIKALKGGESFSMLAAEKSEDTATAPIGGETGWQAATKLQAAIFEAVKTMKVGEIAGPILLPQGYAVVQLLGRRPSTKPTLDQVREQLAEAILQRTWIENMIKLRTEQDAHLIVTLPGQ